MTNTARNEVVRLTPYLCELNPIEMAWLQVKHYEKTHNTEFTPDALQRLVTQEFAQVATKRWASLIKDTQGKVQDVYFIADRLQNWKQVKEFVIHVGQMMIKVIQMKKTVPSVIMILMMKEYEEVQ
uniref:Tc1-like transposase DDE domain-containing protein n=1 Tax=Amphimedon queenslandica TaxID=400682 RepID=A0A1X7TV78_AMPQE